MAVDRGELVLLSGNGNLPLATDIAKHLGMELGAVSVGRFMDNEINATIDPNVRGQDVFVIQPTCNSPEVSNSPNDNLMELLVILDALTRASAHHITAVLPYYGYARQDKIDAGREPITAKLVANMITAAGADRVLTLDLHASQIQGFFDIPVDPLYATPVFVPHIEKSGLADAVIVTPDVGGIRRAKGYAKRLGTSFAVVDKDRKGPDNVEAAGFFGVVDGRKVIIVDDMISTAGSLCVAAEEVKKQGAEMVYAAMTHGVMCGPATERLRDDSNIEEIWVTDSVPVPDNKRLDNLTVISVAGLLSDAIARIHRNESVRELFK